MTSSFVDIFLDCAIDLDINRLQPEQSCSDNRFKASIYQAGFLNVVAPLGTALTANQAKLLSRFAETVVLAFDADTAGLTASERSQEILKEAGLKVRIADLKPHKDPDEFIRAQGAELFFENIKNSRPALEFKIKRILGRFNLKEIEPRAQAAYQVAEVLSREKDHLVQKEYIKFAAELLKLDAELLSAEVSQRNFYFKSSASHPSRRQIVKPPEKVAEAEKRLVRLALGSEGALTVIREQLGPEEFSDPDYRDIISKLATLPAEKLLEEKKAREAMLEEFPEEGQEQVIADCVNTIKGYHLKKQIEKVREDLAEAENKQEVEKVNRLNFEYKGLSEILRSLGR